MALFDSNLFSENQAVTASAASTNSLDFGAPGTPVGAAGALVLDLGLSEVEILVQVTEAFAALTSLTVAVQAANDSTFGSPTTLVASQAIPAASLVKGHKFRIPAIIPEGATERYIRLYYTVAGVNATAGKVFAGVVASRPAAV